MAIIERVAYDADKDLLAPSAHALKGMNTQINGRPTTDAGHYHRHSFRAYSPAERDEQMRRFFRFVSGVRGYSTLAVKTYTYDFFGRKVFGAHVVYAVEQPQMLLASTRS